MGASANLLNPSMPVDPGQEVESDLRVRNNGTVVDQFSFEILGPAASFAKVVPDIISLLPGVDGTVRVSFAPLRLPSTPAGPMPFGVRVLSREDPGGSVVEEGSLDIAPFSAVSAELVPRTSRGRRHAIHDLAVDNRGNAVVNAALGATDPDGLLGFGVVPPTISAPPGSAVFAKVRVRPLKTFLRGPSQTHPFQAQVTPESGAPIRVEGAMLQDALVPAWLPKALAGLVALALLAAIAWFTLAKPQIRSVAKSQVAKQLVAAGILPPPPSASGGKPKTQGGGPGGTTGGTAIAAVGPQIDGRLKISGNGTDSYTVPTGHALQLTDVVLENPNGDAGTLVIARSGTILLQLSMADFRNLDYHFVSPIVFRAEQHLELTTTNCAGACTPGAYYSGFLPTSS